MKVLFKQPRKLWVQDEKKDMKVSKHFPKGVHELPDALLEDWFFKALVEAKDVTIDAPDTELAPDRPVLKATKEGLKQPASDGKKPKPHSLKKAG